MSTINWLDLDGVVNMRDLGGLPTVEGTTIRPGRLLRSDNLQDLAPSAISHLIDRLALSDVIDLRSHYEVESEGPGPLRWRSQVAHHHLTLLPDTGAESGPVDALLTRRNQNRRDDDHWASHYLGYLDERPESVLRALRVLGQAQGATIVHCAAGKDRTGTVVGMALSVAGVPEEAIVADYAASAGRIERIMARLAPRPVYANVIGGDITRQIPKAESMSRVFQALRTRHDGPQGWLAEHGWNDSDTSTLRDALRS